MFYMAKRTIRKQSAEIEWSSVDSITDHRNTTLVRRTKRNTKRRNKTMVITFKVYSPILNKTFVNVKAVATMADFRLYAYSLYSGNWEIISVE